MFYKCPRPLPVLLLSLGQSAWWQKDELNDAVWCVFHKKHLRDWVSWRVWDELQGGRVHIAFVYLLKTLMELLYRFRISLVHSWCTGSEWLSGFALSEPVSHAAALYCSEDAEKRETNQTESYSWKWKLAARVWCLSLFVLLHFVHFARL